MRKPFTLAPSHTSADVVEALEFLLSKARKGDVYGFAYVAQLKQRKFIMDTAGESHRNPLFTLSLVHVLADALSERVRNPGE